MHLGLWKINVYIHIEVQMLSEYSFSFLTLFSYRRGCGPKQVLKCYHPLRYQVLVKLLRTFYKQINKKAPLLMHFFQSIVSLVHMYVGLNFQNSLLKYM